MTVRKTVRFFLNGRDEERAVAPETTALEMLRDDLEMTGTKEGCGEGDCGACTVVLGEVVGGRVRYKATVSCLLPAAQLDGKHLITIEGMARGQALHPIQQAIVEAHATQCGFCTPGIALALLALYLENPAPTPEDVHVALSGNLCRCTGYVSIRKIPDFIDRLKVTPGDMRLDFLDATEARQIERAAAPADDLLVEKGDQVFFSPASEASLRAFVTARAGRPIQFVGGGSDVMVGVKKRGQHPPCLVDLSRLSSLKEIRDGQDRLTFGAAVALEDLALATRASLPILGEAIGQMAARQVRNLATAAGNIANASPVADIVVVLMALDAALQLDGPSGAREVRLDEFFLGYKKLSLAPGEWIRAISVEKGRFGAVNFEKASKRRELDISAVNSAIALALDDRGETIRAARLCCGGVGPTTLLMEKTSAFLVGKPFAEDIFVQAAEVVATEATPMSDVRGSADYRRTVMKNLLVKHFVSLSARRES